jgi:hypothetical protein
MSRHEYERVIVVAVLAVGVTSVGGCGGGGGTPAEVALTATPPRGIQSYPGGTALWLVEVEHLGPAGQPITVTAKSDIDVRLEVVSRTLSASGLVEVIARPGPSLMGRKVDVIVSARRGDAGQTAVPIAPPRLDLPLHVLRYGDQLGDMARQQFEPFVAHLATEHPEFGIDENTDWEGWVSAPNILIVMWYSFLSADWEALVQWHVTIPPYNWTHVYLRRRGSPECAWAGEVPTAGAPVEEVTPPDVFPRIEAPWGPFGGT